MMSCCNTKVSYPFFNHVVEIKSIPFLIKKRIVKSKKKFAFHCCPEKSFCDHVFLFLRESNSRFEKNFHPLLKNLLKPLYFLQSHYK